MQRSALRLSAVAFAALAALALVAAPGGAATDGGSRASRAAGTQALPGPLLGLEAVASNDVWAVGNRRHFDENIGLAEHWDGATWTEVPTPAFGELSGGLVAVSMSGPKDGWAVGNKGIKGFRDQQLVAEHWNGKKWSLSHAPDATFNDIFSDVSALSSDDVWAVGAFDTGGTCRCDPLVEHWDGSSWAIVALPDVTPAQLTGVDAIAADDVWAVGQSGGATLTMHWDGSAWSRVDSPNGGSAPVTLTAVSAAASNDVWAVGTIDEGDPFPGMTLALHWNGTKWSQVKTPSPASGDDVTGVAAFAGEHAWMAGTYWPTATKPKGLTVRFSGGPGTRVKVPGQTILDDIAGVAEDDLWAVGSAGIFHRDASRWRLVVPQT
jgi:hypothetical protein